MGNRFYQQQQNITMYSVENVIVGNGAAEIFASLAKRYENKRAVLIHPTFSEYEATLSPYNVYIKEIIATGKLPLDEVLDEVEFAEVIYICRPNNPTGYLIPLEEIIQIAKYAKRYKCEVILDEAFLDFIDEKESFIPLFEGFSKCYCRTFDDENVCNSWY